MVDVIFVFKVFSYELNNLDHWKQVLIIEPCNVKIRAHTKILWVNSGQNYNLHKFDSSNVLQVT